MSDGFDKEAEREKLRKQLADDGEKRKHTQRMSELLLKGATMTNRHCDDCGDPIFCHNGQEFCPSCHTVDAADAAAAEEAGAPSDAADAGDSGAATPEATSASNRPQPTTPTDPDRSHSSNTTEPPSAQAPSETPRSTGMEAGAADASGVVPARDGSAAPVEASSRGAGSGGVADARASLTRTLHRFAVAAEETDDPRRAREHLQAAREAAEALAALD